MKVFTVGLDQKPPVVVAAVPATEKLPEKPGADSPPPGYVPHLPLPQLPPLPPSPIQPQSLIWRKSRGYKGILMVMLAVFLMAIFALTLSEIAYNRQREENYFRLRWAELKHRLGYADHRKQAPFDYYHRALNGDRMFALSKTKELSDDTTSTTTTASAPLIEPVAPVIFEAHSHNFERQPPIPPMGSLFGGGNGGEGNELGMRDARLQFLKTILQKIKQRAEAMGFDGTMQVSVIEVEPQEENAVGNGMMGGGFGPPMFPGSPFFQPRANGPPPSPQQLFNGFFPPPPPMPPQQQPFRPNLDPKSSAFLDGFGEIHQPTLLQQNQIVEQQRQRENQPMEAATDNIRDFNDIISQNPFRSDASPFFRPNWQIVNHHQPPHIQLQRPAFDRWSGGGGLQHPPPPMSPIGSPNNNNENDNVVVSSDDSDSTNNNHPQHPSASAIGLNHPPAPPPLPMIPIFAQQHQSKMLDSSSGSSSSNPSQEVVGEIYGRKFGRMLQDIIANRIAGFQQLQAQQQKVQQN